MLDNLTCVHSKHRHFQEPTRSSVILIRESLATLTPLLLSGSPAFNMDNRAVRLPPNARRNIFSTQTSRRQNPTTVRPDREAPSIFQQPQEDELVERDDNGEYKTTAPENVYKNMALGFGGDEDEETGESALCFRSG